MAVKTIGQFKPVAKWKVKSSDNGYEYIRFSFEIIDSTHTKVSASLILDAGLSGQQILNLIKQTDGNLKKIPVSKIFGEGVSLDRADIDVTSSSSVEFVITHPDALIDGWEIKIGSASAVVSTSTETDAIWAGHKYYAHHQNGYYFVFYHNGTKPVFRSSADGSTWGGETSIFSTDHEANNWGVRFSGANVLAVTASGASTRKWLHGVIDASDGTITWSAENTGADSSHRGHLSPCFLDGIKIALTSHNGTNKVNTSSARYWFAEGGAGSLAAPTWRGRDGTDIAFSFAAITDTAPFQIFSADQESTGDFVLIGRSINTGSVTNPDRHGIHFYYYYDSAGDFSATELVVSDNTVTPNHIDVNGVTQMSCARDSNGDIHIVYIDISGTAPAGALVHKKVTVIGPASSTLSTPDSDITTLATHTKVFLSIDLATDDLYVFYDKGDDKIYHRKYDGTWGSESNTVKTTGTRAITGAISGSEFAVNDEILLTWTEDDTTDEVMFATISLSGDVTVLPSEQTLTLAQPVPVIDIVQSVTVLPSEQTLTLALPVPTIDIIQSVIITPAEQTLTLAQEIPTVDVSGNVTVTPSVQTLTLAQPVPIIDITGSIIVTPSEQILTLTPETPTIKIDVTVLPSEQILTLIQEAPTVAIGVDIIVTPPALALVLTPEAVTVAMGVTVFPEALTLVLTQESPSLSIDTIIIISSPLALVLSLPDVTVTTPTTPPVSISKEIIAAIIAQLKTITIANSYNTEIGNSVVDWQTANIPIADLPLIEVNDTGEVSEIKGQYHYNILTVELIGKILSTNVDTARNLQKDIITAMVARPAFPSNVYYFLPSEKPEFLIEKADRQIAGITLSYEIKYREKLL